MIVQVGGQRVWVQVQSSGIARASAFARAAAASEAAVQAIFDVAGEVQSGASVTYLSSGTGAIARNMQTRLHDSLCVLDFGVTGDGVTDDAAAIRVAIAAAAGRSLYFPNPSGGFYLCNSSLGEIPNSTRLYGESKRSTQIRANFNSGSLMSLADGASLAVLYINGNSKTCKGVEIIGVDVGNQHMDNVRVINFANDCLYFGYKSGSGFNALNLEAYRSDGASGSGNYAIVIEDLASGLGPKHFFGLETGGKCAFKFGGGNNVFVIGCTLADCLFSVNNQSIHIVGGRIANATTMTILGSGVSIIGGDVNPQIILGSGCQSCYIAPAAANNSITDNSGTTSNLVFEPLSKAIAAPVIATSGGAITIGNGDASGTWQRTGAIVSGTMNFIVGSSTAFTGGGGFLRFAMPPDAPISLSAQYGVSGHVRDVSAGTYPTVTGIVDRSGGYITLLCDGVVMTHTSPVALATGDEIHISFNYTV
jgi:hypothetical protein